MKRCLEFAAMAAGIPWIQGVILLAVMIVIFLLCSGCSSEEVIDKINGLPSDDRINAQYEHASQSAPASLKPYYDPQLTRDLNK